MRIFVTPFYNRLQKMKIYIKPKDLNEKVLQNNPCGPPKKEMGSVQKVLTNDLKIKLSKKKR